VTEKPSADLVIVGASEVNTCVPSLGEGASSRIVRGAVAVRGETIVWVGEETDLHSSVEMLRGATEIDAGGGAVIPGFVDAHTHLVFGGTRRDEFAARSAGQPYQAAGILDTVEATRKASTEDLTALTRDRARMLLEYGVTTAEAKSGYSLDVEGERRLLEVLTDIDRTEAIDLELTFCGAHAVPAEFEGRPDDYIDLVCDEMLELCTPLAKWCDVFCDVGAFSPAQAKRVLEAAKAFGLAPRIHANELGSTGGARIAAETGAASADHLLFLRPSEARALASVGCVAVLAPITALGLGRFPNVRLMKNAGLQIAIGSDLNPGAAPSANLQFALGIATRSIGMGPLEALVAATYGGASALRRDDIGRLAPGCLADVVVLSTESAKDLGYHAGVNLAELVIKRGNLTRH
jgi:imidazolonepropionase